MAYLRILFCNLAGWTEDNHRKLRIFGVQAQIQTGYLLKIYHLIHLAWQKDDGRRLKTRAFKKTETHGEAWLLKWKRQRKKKTLHVICRVNHN
jgi:hypothetical protein